MGGDKDGGLTIEEKDITLSKSNEFMQSRCMKQ